MKIDTDLRLAIKSAEKLQPQDNWTERNKREQASIASLFGAKPHIHAKAKKLAASIKRHRDAEEKAEKELCQSYGLRARDGQSDYVTGFTIGGCENSSKAFEKAGGKIITKNAPWKFNAVMAQLAAATPKEGAKIIKSLGINWT